MFRFETLEIWRLSIGYGKTCYKLADSFPGHERYSLSDQLRRAAISISNNIAEGSVGSNENFKRYLNIAIGSTLETINIINFAQEVGYINPEAKASLYEDTERLVRKITKFIEFLQTNKTIRDLR